MEESDCLRTPDGKIFKALITIWRKAIVLALQGMMYLEESDCSRTPRNKYWRKAIVFALHNII